MSRIRIWNWRAGAGIALLGVLSAACAPGTRAVSHQGTTPAQVVTPATASSGSSTQGQPVAPAAGADPSNPLASQDQQAAALDSQSVDQSLAQIESDLSSMDQATSTGENDVPSS